MPQLEFKFSSDQAHQNEAIKATCDLFAGQQFMKTSFTADAYKSDSLFAGKTITTGHGNDVRVTPGQLEQNLHEVQEDNCLPPTNETTEGRLRDFTIEMETGTGKTYVYIRTIYELNKRFGLTKFVIVVPSVAIREGVVKSFQTTKSHFEVLYDHTPLDYFVYNSKDMGPVSNFATSSSIQVMVINIDAFNKGLTREGDAKEGNLFHRKSERLAGGRSPQELVSECKPIVIIDEPQSVDNTKQAQAAIKSLGPLFVLRYSATHKKPYNMIYRLGPVDAFERHLVKGICVDSIMADTDLNGAYVRLESTSADPYRAKITIDVRQKNGSQKRKTVTVKTGTDLLEKSNGNTDYEAGWVVHNIGTAVGREFVEFQNGDVLEPGQAVGDVAEEAIKRAQIRRTIENHLERQFELWGRGVKVLSLFFIDRVDRYRVYEPEVHKGVYAQMFEEEYAAVLNSRAKAHVVRAAKAAATGANTGGANAGVEGSANAGVNSGQAGGATNTSAGTTVAGTQSATPSPSTWRECYAAVGMPLVEDPAAVHQGYFAQDKKGKFKDSRGAAGTADDAGAFELIMQKKETLITFPDGRDPEKNVAFIFSHSALKEGWDNPNVFQICTLVETKDNLTKRQKIGRGLRLCVNQEGERLYDPEANVLTVIANESYDQFAEGLQREFEADNIKFGIITPETFTKVVVRDEAGNEERLGYEKSKQLFDHFVAENLVDKKGAVSENLKSDAERGRVDLPDGFESARDEIQSIIIHKAAKGPVIRDKKDEVTVELQKDVSLSPEFQELWNRIRQRTRFDLNIDSEKIITESIDAVNQMATVKPPNITSERASLDVSDAGVASEATGTSLVNVSHNVEYDLPDPVAELQDAVGLTRKTIAAILEGCSRFAEFKVDPATFLAQVSNKINKVKQDQLAAGIEYTKLAEEDWYTMRDLELNDYTAYLGQNAWKPEVSNKCLYNYVVYDSAGVEKSFAESLDKQEEVLVFAKLPSSFKIDTPLGTYNPDWAYVEEHDGEQHVYFVTETKGGKNGEPSLRDTERAKIKCAERHFNALDLGDNFRYDVETEYKFDDHSYATVRI